MVIEQRSSRAVWVLLATVLTVAVTASLGRWQLSRADQKEAIQSAMAQRLGMPALAWRDLQGRLSADDASIWHHRTLTVEGSWVPDSTVFLDNRNMDGRVGFLVITPFRIPGESRWLAVQRGWVPRDLVDRARLPQVPVEGGLVTITGRLAPPPSRLVELGEETPGRIRQNLDFAIWGPEIGAELLPISLLQQDSQPLNDGLLRRWPQALPGVHKHYGYAFQWFSLSTLAVVLYVWFQILLPRRRRARAESPPG